MNTIQSRQNSDLALKCQASARHYYDNADLFDNIYWIGIIVTIILKAIFKESIIVDYLLIIWFFITFFLDSMISKFTSKAAKYKQNFDEFVFGWIPEISKSISNEVNIIESRNKKNFKTQMNHNGNDTPRGVKDWYEYAENENNQEMVIKKAIGENVQYDKSINIILLIILVTLSLLTILIFKDKTILEYLQLFFLIMASLSKKVISTIFKVLRVNSLNKEIETGLKFAKTENDFKEIQNIVFAKRQISSVTPKWIYLLKKDSITRITKIIFSN